MNAQSTDESPWSWMGERSFDILQFIYPSNIFLKPQKKKSVFLIQKYNTERYNVYIDHFKNENVQR